MPCGQPLYFSTAVSAPASWVSMSSVSPVAASVPVHMSFAAQVATVSREPGYGWGLAALPVSPPVYEIV